MADDATGPGPTVVPMVTKPSEFTMLVEKAARDIETTLVLQGHIAKVRRAAYLAYLKEGFTEQQALELCTK